MLRLVIAILIEFSEESSANAMYLHPQETRPRPTETSMENTVRYRGIRTPANILGFTLRKRCELLKAMRNGHSDVGTDFNLPLSLDQSRMMEDSRKPPAQ